MHRQSCLIITTMLAPLVHSLSHANFGSSHISKIPPPSTDYLHIAAPNIASRRISLSDHLVAKVDSTKLEPKTVPAATKSSLPSHSSGYVEWRQQLDAPTRRVASPFFSQAASAGADFLHQNTNQGRRPVYHQQLPDPDRTLVGTRDSFQTPLPNNQALEGPPFASPQPQTGSYLESLNNSPQVSTIVNQENNHEERYYDDNGNVRSGWQGQIATTESVDAAVPNSAFPRPQNADYTRRIQQLDAPPARQPQSGSSAAFFSKQPLPGASFLHYHNK